MANNERIVRVQRGQPYIHETNYYMHGDFKIVYALKIRLPS